MRNLNILWLWPDILNLHGDRGNVMALVRVCKLYGIEPKVTRVNRLSDMFWIESADIILLGPGELAVLPQITSALAKQYAALKTFAESGGILFATGTTGAALGVQTLRTDGSRLFGLGLLDMECIERTAVLGDDLIFRLSGDRTIEQPVYATQIQMIDVKPAEGQNPFGEILYGYGNNGGGFDGTEKNGVIFSNATGPVLIKNPWLTLDLIRRALARRTPGLPESALRFDPALFEIELAAAEAIRKFNEKKERPK